MKLPLLLALSFLIQSSFAAHLTSYKFPGYGFSWYDPACGFACNNAISSAPLSCTSTEHGHSHHGSGPTSPECYASDSAYLTTLAYCIKSNCDPAKVPTWKREKYWATKVISGASVAPKWDYSRALEEIIEEPTVEYNSSSGAVLNETMLVPMASYDMNYKFNVMFDHIEMLQARYVIVIVVVGFGTPILFTLLARLPFMTTAIDKIQPYLVYPSIFRGYHVRPLPWLLGNAPTVGQALYIVMFFILNLILGAVNYDSTQPHPWYFPPKEELLAYIGYRTGHIGYALLPLLILFSGRNNFLLWITDWSHSTYLLLHRWVARIFAIHAIVHSITLLITYTGTGSYPTESTQPYWLWGIVATVLTCAMLVFSHLYFRRLAYEAFLILHILMAVFVIAGCWYHVILKWGYNFYDNWLFAACAVWFFDRLVRVLRIAKNGVRRAIVTDVGEHHVRIDVPDVRWASMPGHVAYVYFPSLNPLRPWENHPFSLNSTALFRDYKHVSHTPASGSSAHSHSPSRSRPSHDLEKSNPTVSQAVVRANSTETQGTAGVTFVVKKNTGLTRLLKSHARLLTLLDGPYPHNPSTGIMQCDRVVLIAGGIGITGLLAWTRAHPNVRLAWSVKAGSEALVAEMGGALGDLVDKEVRVGERVDVEGVLRAEAQRGYKKVGVVVCGPPGMCDDVRAVVSALGRQGPTVWELEVDAYSW
ncbi:hypothetical protein M501DRAFT_989858 [Patellaria atrata CBS 101060]|uniref:Ferric oxidoreductase domain-containing protein n=1 Tax=Patellaria atrata CBS 101060 TaxID=1346257 RepID=A0A9P4SES1_9PEZI|nr:hypothetical protein M501DRAFT_989858 [Patellaria atrata CBS 101060]